MRRRKRIRKHRIREPGLGRGHQKGPENTRKFSGGPENDQKTCSKKRM
jgi:hypothetical protein